MAEVSIGYAAYTETAVASAATCNIGAAATMKVEITGTTTITSFGPGQNRIRYIRFADALTLTHSASLSLPNGGSNIVTAAGDTCTAMSGALGNWIVTNYQKKSGGPVNDALAGWAGKTPPDGTVVGTTDAQTLTNKTIAYGSNTLTGVAATGVANTFSTAQSVSTASTGALMTLTATNNSASSGPALYLNRVSGDPVTNDAMGAILFQGSNDAPATVTYAHIFCSGAAVAAGAHTGHIYFQTYTGGTVGNAMIVGAGLQVGAPTGGMKTAGSINAVSVYDDNVLLTCLPMQREFLEEGTVDTAKWDSVAPGGHHPAAHAFAALVAAGFDPRSPAAYVEKAKADQALPGMPTREEWQHGTLSTGEMLTRLWLAVEMLAVAWMASEEKKEAAS